MKRKIKKTIDRLVAEARHQINNLMSQKPYLSLDQDIFPFSLKSRKNYASWCERHQLDPEDQQNFYLYYGIHKLDSDQGLIKFTKYYNIAYFEEMLDRAWELNSTTSSAKRPLPLEIKENWSAVLKAKTSSTEFTKHRINITYHLKDREIDWKFDANYRGISADGQLTLQPCSAYGRTEVFGLPRLLKEMLSLLGFKTEPNTQVTLQKYQYRRPPRPFKAWHRYHMEKRLRQLSKEWRKEDKDHA